MKYFKDAANSVYAYESDGSQDAFIKPGLTAITQADADALRNPAPTLAQAQATQTAKMYDAYQGAITRDVTFTTAGAMTKAFQADQRAQDNANKMLAAYKTAVPAGFYWVSSDNTQCAFTLSDLQGLAKAMGDQGWAAFQQLQNRKASIAAATTPAAVQAVVW